MKHTIRRVVALGAGVLLCAMILLLVVSVTAHAQSVNRDVCADCHDNVEHFETTSHGTYFQADSRLAEAGCEACHGPALEHVEDGDPEKIINPGTDDQFSANSLCLDCHKGWQFDDWSFSVHNVADINCASCHAVHKPGFDSNPINTGPQGNNELCYTCHSDIRGATYMPSRHPIAEGKIKCVDCHNVHGGELR